MSVGGVSGSSGASSGSTSSSTSTPESQSGIGAGGMSTSEAPSSSSIGSNTASASAASAVQQSMHTDTFEAAQPARGPSLTGAPAAAPYSATTPAQVAGAAPAEVTIDGVTIKTNGATPAAVEEATALVDQLVNRDDIEANLAKAGMTMVVIPEDTKLTDLPEFSHLQGQQTFDGRTWDDVRGVASVRAGRSVIAVAEENLAELASDPYPGTYSTGLHELAHAIHHVGITEKEEAAIDRAYAARRAAGGPFTDSYAASNAHEYFAQASNVFFGRTQTPEKDAGWLQRNDPALYGVLTGIYGQP